MANKKINQLVAKTTIQSTDLFPIGDATTGTLYKKTIADLQAAIGGAVISVNGLVGTVVLDADDILETATPTNRYFTEARARAAISLTTSGSSGASTYSSSTGVLNIPTYTLAGLGGITATFLSGGTGITYNSTTGVISYSGTVYTDSSVRALFSGGTGISYNSSTGAISYSGTVYTDASIRALFSATAPITYNSTTGAIGISTGNLTESTSSVLTITGGTGALLSSASIQVKQASGSQSGFLSSTDWTTFNSKQNALTNPVTGTGTSGYHAKFTGTSTIANSVIYDDGTSVGIGTTTPDTYLNIGTGIGLTLLASGTNTSANLNLIGNGTGFGGISLGNATIRRAGIFALDGSAFAFYTNATNSGTSLTERMRITSAGNVGIGTTSPNLYDPSGNNLVVYEAGNAGITIATGSTNFGSIFFARETGTSGAYRGYIEYGQTNDYMGFGTVSTERMRITSGGSIIINKTSVVSNERLSVTGSTNIWGVVRIENDTNQADVNHGTLNIVNTRTTYAVGNEASIMFSAFNSTASMQPRATIGMQVASDLGGHLVFNTRNDSGSGERMRITSAGNVGIGVTSPNGMLHVAGRIYGTTTGILSDFNSGGLISYGAGSTTKYTQIGYDTTGAYGWIQALTTGVSYNSLVINSAGGNLLLGTTTDNGEKLYVNGAIRATGTITANSDISLKKNLLKIENALEKVEQINGYTYEFKEDDSKRHAGVIAQEIQEVLPEIVNKGNDGILGVEYGNISALLIEAIKEQQAQINELKALLNK